MSTIVLFIYPDRHVARGVWRYRARQDEVRLTYPSGSTWIVAANASVRHVQSDRGAIAVVGDFTGGAESLHRLLDTASGLSDIRVPDLGSVIVVIQFDGETRVQGTMTGSTSVFWTDTPDGTIASDSALSLAQLVHAPLDEHRLALNIADNIPLHMTASGTHWQGVLAVRPQHWLHIRSAQPARTARWWHPPQAVLPLELSAERLREALLDTLKGGLDSPGSVSADLSGGLDSTSIVYALDHLGQTPSVFHASSANPWNDDSSWAERTARELHLELIHLGTFASHSSAFGNQPATMEQLDHPPVWSASSGYLDLLSRQLAGRQTAVHFTGLGGDELFGYLPGLIWSLAQRQGSRHPAIQRFRQLHRWPRRATHRALRSRHTPADEFSRALRGLRTAPAEGPSESLSWNPRVTLPPWASAHTESFVRRALSAHIASGDGPLDEDRSRHQMLESLHFQGTVLRQINQVYGGVGRAWRAPFLNAAVVEVAMSLRVEDRFGASEAKPLLAAAVASFMPKRYFLRNGKGEYSMDIYSEFAAKRNELIGYFTESKLAHRGLIDVDALASSIASPAAAGDVIAGIERLVSIERWVTSVDTSLGPAASHAAKHALPPATLTHSVYR